MDPGFDTWLQAGGDGPASPQILACGIALEHEANWIDVAFVTGSDWPEGACVESSIALRDELRERVPSAGAEYVWGTYEVRTGGARVRLDHAWVVLAGGMILDLTLGQFIPERKPLGIVLPGTPLHARYREVEREQV